MAHALHPLAKDCLIFKIGLVTEIFYLIPDHNGAGPLCLQEISVLQAH